METSAMMKRFSLFLLLLTCACLPAAAQQKNEDGSVTVSGLIIPRDDDGMYVRNSEGQFEIEWSAKADVALEVNTRLFAGLEGDVLRYKVHSSKQMIDFALPAGPITGIVTVRAGRHLETALKEANEEQWIAERGLEVYFNQQPESEQLPTPADPRFVGVWDPATKPRTLSINDKKYEVSLKKGGQSNALLFNVLTTKDCKPFVTRGTVTGRLKGDVIVADRIQILPIGDQTASDDPKLPRYLFVGDSISGNYDKGLREALAGNFNLHHPPTNCGASGKGKQHIVEWLGGYQQKGRHWDVISFNFGHWDAGSDKATYQSNLEAVITELKKTRAKLVWVTTCPVPTGMPPAGDLDENGRAPRRTSGVMRKYLNPWALEVMRRHPEISVCDQWQFVADDEEGLFKDWWPGDNVHFGADTGAALGQFLARHIVKVMHVSVDASISSGRGR
jgi:hypothetical protein